MGSPYPVFVYSDHEALRGIFSTGQTEKGRIANWMDRLGGYDMKLTYRASMKALRVIQMRPLVTWV